MNYHRLHGNAAIVAVTATLAGLALSPSPAAANVEAGGTVGGHIFSKNNELGVADRPTADSLHNSIIFGVRLGFFFSDILGVEGELAFLPTSAREAQVDVSAMTYRAHLVAQFLADKPESRFIPFVLVGAGAMHIVSSSAEEGEDFEKDGDEVLYGGAGVKYRMGESLGLRFDVRAMFPPSSADEFAAFDAEVLLSFYMEWGRKEKEGVPAPAKPVIGDKDDDGLKDDVDICPTEPEDADGFKDEDGCPDTDDDEDGIPDTSDACRTEPEDVDGFEDADGCPELDNDKDGILDLAPDQCPVDPEDLDKFEDENGCPDPDNDQDGVLDPQDQCPDSMETMNGYQDEDGCYDDVPKAVAKFTGVIKGITFKVDSADILKSSNKTLDAAVKVLVEYPDTKLEIQGHTDDTGDDAYNKDLSQRRAESVKAYLVDKGIDASRLTAVGYGRDVPIDDRTTKAARAKNRRVEFKLITSTTSAPANP